MDTAFLIAEHPRLYHLAEVGALTGIRRYGLLSVSAILDRCRISGRRRDEIEAARRPESVLLTDTDGTEFVLRDQKPLDPAKLAGCLDGIGIVDWFRLLNQHVYLWPTRQRCEELLSARAYRDRSHLVLEIDTARLMAAHEERVRLTPINTGAVLYNPARRGADTFKTVSDYPYEERRRARGRRHAIAEVAVRDAVPDVIELINCVYCADRDRWTALAV